MKRVLLFTFGAFVASLILIQFIPFGRNHINPAVVQEPNWDSPRTRNLR